MEAADPGFLTALKDAGALMIDPATGKTKLNVQYLFLVPEKMRARLASNPGRWTDAPSGLVDIGRIMREGHTGLEGAGIDGPVFEPTSDRKASDNGSAPQKEGRAVAAPSDDISKAPVEDGDLIKDYGRNIVRLQDRGVKSARESAEAINSQLSTEEAFCGNHCEVASF